MADTTISETKKSDSFRMQYWSLMRLPSFLVFLGGRIVSSMGDMLFQIATMWYVLEKTNSPLSAAIVPIIPLVTSIVLSQPLATIADRMPKKRVMVLSDVIRGAVVLGVAIAIALNDGNRFFIYSAVFLLTFNGFLFGPAQNAVLPKILPNADLQLTIANSLLRAVSQLIALVGYAVGGILVSMMQPRGAIIADGISFFISAASISVLPIPLMRAAGRKGAWGFVRDSFAGLQFVLKNPSIRTFALFVGFINFSGGPVGILTAVFSHSVLHAGLRGYGYLEAAFALGGMLGAIVSTWASRKLTLWQLSLVALVGSGAAIASLPIARNLPEAIVALIFSSLVTAMMSIPVFTALQLLAPNEIRGRVMAGFILFANLGDPLGLLLGSWLMGKVSPSPVFMASGMLLILCGFLSLFIPSIRMGMIGWNKQENPVHKRLSE